MRKPVPVWQPVDFQLHWQSAPVGNCVKGKRTNKPNSLPRNVGEAPWQNLTPACSAASV
jgi:hypothetical protein